MKNKILKEKNTELLKFSDKSDYENILKVADKKKKTIS